MDDAFCAAGIGLVSYGAFLVYPPAGFIVAGALLLAGGVLIARGKHLARAKL